MVQEDAKRRGERASGIGAFLERNSGRLIAAAVAVTLLLTIPYLTLKPDREASADPSGQVFDLMDDYNQRFASPVHWIPFIAEARDGDMLTQAALWTLYRSEQALREADARGELAAGNLEPQPYLYHSFDLDANQPFVGVRTIADAVQEALVAFAPGTTLETATDDQVKLALHYLLSSPAASGLLEQLSAQAPRERRTVLGQEIDYWVAPAIVFTVLADNERLGGGTQTIGLGGSENIVNKEKFNRAVQSILRRDESAYRLWGIAIDVNLESEDEGSVAGMFIMFTVIGAVLVVGLALRSYWAMALTGAGLGALIIWLKGISNLIGLKGGLITDLIVPVAMISLGVDFAVHALRRYDEEKGPGRTPARALRLAFAGVLGALALAMLSDSAAFLANVPSGIEAVIHFGIAAAIAVVSSFVVLGIVVPLVMMRIDRVQGTRPLRRSLLSKANLVVSGVSVAVLSGTAVIFMVAPGVVPTGVELAIYAGTVLAFIVFPLLFAARRRRPARTGVAEAGATESVPFPVAGGNTGRLAEAIIALAKARWVVIPFAAVVTVVAAVFALKLEATFDVKDFFDSKSDFVVSLDKLDEYVGDRGGEPALAYIRGDFSDRAALEAMDRFVDRLRADPYVARGADGNPVQGQTVLSLVRRMTRNEYARGAVARASGVDVRDADGDGIPDTREGLRATLDYMVAHGVPLDEQTLVFKASQVRQSLYHRPAGGEEDVAVISVGIPGTRRLEIVKAARQALEADVAVLRESKAITFVGLTGSPFTRLESLEASTKTLEKSIPIAAVSAFLMLLAAMRSFRYAIVTIIPIGLVVAWLYAIMYAGGFAFNFVTATIGAVSIGVGIDYSIHMTERFREELGRASGRLDALRRAARGTGVALAASAASSIVGFAILGFAPMPMFSSYGILTAIMISLALAAAVLVLPSLLLLVTPETAAASKSAGESDAA